MSEPATNRQLVGTPVSEPANRHPYGVTTLPAGLNGTTRQRTGNCRLGGNTPRVPRKPPLAPVGALARRHPAAPDADPRGDRRGRTGKTPNVHACGSNPKPRMGPALFGAGTLGAASPSATASTSPANRPKDARRPMEGPR